MIAYNKIKQIIRLYSIPKFVFLNKFIKNYSKDKIKVLDVGCGNKSPSITTSLFPKIEYFGLDKEDYNLTIENKRILENRYFRIEHTTRGTEILEILAKKLKVGGGIYIEFPSVKSLAFPSMPGTLNFCDDPTHVRLYDIKEVANTLIKCGFKVIKAGTRRNFIRCLLTSMVIIYQLMKIKKIEGGAFWDILGFAEFVYAVKIKSL